MQQQVNKQKGTIPFDPFISHRVAICIHAADEGSDIGHCHETMGNGLTCSTLAAGDRCCSEWITVNTSQSVGKFP